MDLSALTSWRHRHKLDPRLIIIILGTLAAVSIIAANAAQPTITRRLPDAILFGIFIGSIYAVVALGYTMVYGILKFINFAHGEVFMWGGYFVFVFCVMGRVNFFIGCFVAVMCTTLLGITIERIGYRPLRRAPRLAPLITAIGFSLFLQSAALYFFKANTRSIAGPIGGVDIIRQRLFFELPPAPFFTGGIVVFLALLYFALWYWKGRGPEPAKRSNVIDNIVLVFLVLFAIAFLVVAINASTRDSWAVAMSSPVKISMELIDAVFVLTAIIIMLLLHFIVKYTQLGKAMRAVSDDMDSAAAVGIDVDRVIASTFAIGSFVAGVGGILFGLKYTIYPYMGFLPGLKAFAAAVVGGIGNIYGAMIGGLIIGLSEMIGPLGLDAVGIKGTPYQDAIAFIILIVFLILKPSGLMGKEHLVMSRGK